MQVLGNMSNGNAALVVFLHLLLSLPNGSGQVFNLPSDLSSMPNGTAVIDSLAAQQETGQEPPAPEIPNRAPETQPVVANSHSGVPTPEQPTRPEGPITPAQAQERAQTLLGKRAGRVEFYYSEEEKVNYLAFCSRRESGGSEIWLYEESGQSHELRQRWHEVFDVFNMAPDRFIALPDQKLPLLRLKGIYGGSAASNTRLAVYSGESDNLSWIDYQENRSVLGLPKITVDEEHASDPQIRTYLKSWAHSEGIDRPRVPADPQDIVNVEQAWVHVNGYISSGIVKMQYYRNLDVRGDHFRIDDKRYVITNVSDGRYTWYSIFKGPVGGYDKVTHEYFMVYVQEDAYAWADRLKAVGPWVYIAPRDENWKLRFNKVTRELQQGNFANIVESVSAISPSGPPRNKVSTISIHPYDLVKNSFAYRGTEVRLDAGSWPYVLNGQVYQWVPIVGGAWGGIQFQRMLTENEALYDVRGLDMNGATSELTTMGQLVVVVPSANSQLDLSRVWLVRPLGVEAGTNYFGAVIQIPKVQFLRYAQE